jgi:hypothetical protein
LSELCHRVEPLHWPFWFRCLRAFLLQAPSRLLIGRIKSESIYPAFWRNPLYLIQAWFSCQDAENLKLGDLQLISVQILVELLNFRTKCCDPEMLRSFVISFSFSL